CFSIRTTSTSTTRASLASRAGRRRGLWLSRKSALYEDGFNHRWTRMNTNGKFILRTKSEEKRVLTMDLTDESGTEDSATEGNEEDKRNHEWTRMNANGKFILRTKSEEKRVLTMDLTDESGTEDSATEGDEEDKSNNEWTRMNANEK